MMRPMMILAALALTAAAPPGKPAARSLAHPAARTAARPAAHDWSLVAARLPGGTFVQGNPAAKHKVAEYLSLTCPHCARMAATATPPFVRDYVGPGKVNYEIRPASRDPLDLVAFTLARCRGPAGFFAVLTPLYAAQDDWVTKGYAYLQAGPAPAGKSNGEVMAMVAHAAGLDAFFASHGLPAARQAACLKDERDAAALSKMAERIWQPGFAGTPTYEVDGKDAGTLGSWDDLKAALVKAGA